MPCAIWPSCFCICWRRWPDSPVLAAEIFSANSYATGIFGKWHLGGHYPFRPNDRGFQQTLVHGDGAIGTTGDIWGNDYFDDTYWRNGKPFFCYLPTNAPHGPLVSIRHE